MTEPRYRVAPLVTEWLTADQALDVLTNWINGAPGNGAPTITVSKQDRTGAEGQNLTTVTTSVPPDHTVQVTTR
jgi:hypothetical protein